MLGELGRLFDLIEDESRSMGVSVVASAVDEHGNNVLFMRMKGSTVHSIDMAVRKAFTSISMGCETASLTALVQPGQPLYGLTEASGGRLVAFGGGITFELSTGESLGIGVSGGTSEQDIEILKKAVAAVKGERNPG
jgi:uncharacterized protein GlcG (DUF336 family)